MHGNASIIERVRALRFRDGVDCVHCGGRHVQRWGRFGDRQRYRCVGCRRTFSDFTGTPLAHLKRVDLLTAFCGEMFAARPLRATARRLRVDKDTAFRWRHRVLAGLAAAPRPTLEGDIHVFETPFAFSEKGRRDLDRPARRHGLLRLTDAPLAWALLARDGRGRIAAAMVGLQRSSWYDVTQLLAPCIESGGPGGTTIVDRHGRHAAAGRAASGLGCAYRRAGPEDRAEISAGICELRGWLRRFRGVATRHLDRYLAWHCLLSRADVPVREKRTRLVASVAQQLPGTEQIGASVGRAGWRPGPSRGPHQPGRPGGLRRTGSPERSGRLGWAPKPGRWPGGRGALGGPGGPTRSVSATRNWPPSMPPPPAAPAPAPPPPAPPPAPPPSTPPPGLP